MPIGYKIDVHYAAFICNPIPLKIPVKDIDIIFIKLIVANNNENDC